MSSSPAEEIGHASPTDLAPAPSSLPRSDQVEARKIANLEVKVTALEAQIEDTEAKLVAAAAKLKNPDPGQTVNNHIRLLREYNDVRDMGTSLMGIIADNRQVQMKSVYEDFHVDEKD